MNTLEKREHINQKETPNSGEKFDAKGYYQSMEEINKEKVENKKKQTEKAKNLNKTLYSIDEGRTINEDLGNGHLKETLPITENKTLRSKLKSLFRKKGKWRPEDKKESRRSQKKGGSRWNNKSDRMTAKPSIG